MKESGSMKTMKKLLVMAFAAVMGCAGCQQELIDPNAVENDTLKVYATIEDTDDTKTSLSDKEVYWTSGDRIAVFMNKTLRKRFEVSSESVGTKEGTFLYDSDYIATGKNVAISNNVAYYPFCEVTCAVSGSTYTLSNVTLPSTQNYTPSSFCQGAFPMVSVTADADDLDFAFRNLCGVLSLQLKGSGTIKSITVKGNSGELLSGKAAVTASYGKNPEISLLSGGDKTVTLDCGEAGVALQNDTPTSFYIVLPPVAFDNGFTVTVTDASGATKEYSTTKKNVIHRSGILRMPEKEYVGERVPQEGDYIDEYGINHGQGVEIDGVVWAPVNCGYHATDFKYGKLYQWGRKYGQGYSGSLYDVSGSKVGTYSDATVPTVVSGPVDLATGQSKGNENSFYTYDSYPYDWLSPRDDKLWNSGTEENPVKTEYDPCPEGWRVPTYVELDELRRHRSSWTSEGGQPGYWFSGASSYTENVPQVFFPAAGGRRYYVDGDARNRGYAGYYWSSRANFYNANYLYFDSGNADVYNDGRAFGFSVRCVQDDATLIPVKNITLSKSTLALSPGTSETLSSTITPSNANHRSAHWWSDNSEVATVDQNGKVTAISAGTTIVYAMAGMQVATCKVTVNASSQEDDYIDEYGINHGPGVKIGETVWAPVNCGYHETDFKYGKLYQWGRKYGQGYKGDLYNGEGKYLGEYSDALFPERTPGPVSLKIGQAESNADRFYYVSNEPYDWCNIRINHMWNLGTEEIPIKTEYDPCPNGWRVPTYTEFTELRQHHSSWTIQGGQEGYWFSGPIAYSSAVNQVFLPASGYRTVNGGEANSRGRGGSYFSSRPYVDRDNDHAYNFGFFGAGSSSGLSGNRRVYGYSVRCVQDNSVLIPVQSVTLNITSLTLSLGASETLSSTITPSNANHQSAHWWSDDPEVATVDQNGNVTPVSAGTTTIYAMAGMQVAACEVTVKSDSKSGDYIDEYGVNHGKGVAIGMAIWAPVNCGYHATDFKYGKLYQWGRKYGQGYSGALYDGDLNYLGDYSDSEAPSILSGPVSLSTGQSKANEDKFYYASSDPWDWCSPQDHELWNSGSESAPVKTEYDPCPEGWRVPTYAELAELTNNYSSWTIADNGQMGIWFSGPNLYTASVPQVFFPAAGYRNDDDGGAYYRGYFGCYWSSRPYNTNAILLSFYSNLVSMYNGYRAAGCSVRCVQVTD